MIRKVVLIITGANKVSQSSNCIVYQIQNGTPFNIDQLPTRENRTKGIVSILTIYSTNFLLLKSNVCVHGSMRAHHFAVRLLFSL